MNSYSALLTTPIQLGIAAVILLAGFTVYTTGIENIINPSAQQKLDAKGTTVFFIYVAIVIALAITSIQMKSLSTFFFVLALLSFIWYIMKGSWQYVPV
jgi:hypothetical protein